MPFILRADKCHCLHTRASYLAYDNMRAYVNDSPPSWFKCDASASTGYKVMTKSGHVDGLPGVVKQEVIASAPYGCKGSKGMSIKVESIME